jgi:hypothetical protein
MVKPRARPSDLLIADLRDGSLSYLLLMPLFVRSLNPERTE